MAEGIHGKGCRRINIGRWHTDQSPRSRPELCKYPWREWKVAVFKHPRLNSRASIRTTNNAEEGAFDCPLTFSLCSASISGPIFTVSFTRCKLITLILTRGLILPHPVLRRRARYDGNFFYGRAIDKTLTLITSWGCMHPKGSCFLCR